MDISCSQCPQRQKNSCSVLNDSMSGYALVCLRCRPGPDKARQVTTITGLVLRDKEDRHVQVSKVSWASVDEQGQDMAAQVCFLLSRLGP